MAFDSQKDSPRTSSGAGRTWPSGEETKQASASSSPHWVGDMPCANDVERLAILEVVELVETKRRAIGAPPNPVEWRIGEHARPIAAGAPRAAAIVTSLLRIASEADCVSTVCIEVQGSGEGVELAVVWRDATPPRPAGRRINPGMLTVRLNLVRQLLDMVQGRMDVDWDEACPTRLRVWLPCVA